ncbi:hypothetical protein [Flavobacterium luteolum]|uniref:hypothetical protein n=1 Tax=Flavobacterium luteolum TaxID=3003259 RepID=UPI00248D762D|nr:hypothetical protein [Flavobacterium luteolum]
MEQHNFASYKSGTFSTDITNFTITENLFAKKDMPAFVHEYCHYIQDITNISSIFGFSLWMRDLVNMTQIFSNGEGKTISIPLDRDQYGETINKFRKYYNLYCGDSNDVFELDYSQISFKERHQKTKEIELDGKIQHLITNTLELENHGNKLYFGLIVLQEIHAYYAQQLAEGNLPGVDLSIYSKDLPSYPYKFGDFLFREFNISIDLRSKFLLIDLCLDTIQSTSIFLDVLEQLKGKSVTAYGENRMNFVEIVDEAVAKCSYSTSVALTQIIPDLKMWSQGQGREHLSEALKWYIEKIELVYEIKKNNAPSFFSLPFTTDWKDFALLFESFPSPVYIKDGILMRTYSNNSDDVDKEFNKEFDAASTIWSHRILYDFLCSENLKQIDQRGKCPMYENCHFRPQIGDDYTCKRSPWEIIKNEKEIVCYYGMAAHSYGLWQNNLDIKTD